MRLGCTPTLAKGMTGEDHRRGTAGAAVADSPAAISPSRGDLHEAGTEALTAEQAAERAAECLPRSGTRHGKQRWH